MGRQETTARLASASRDCCVWFGVPAVIKSPLMSGTLCRRHVCQCIA